MQRAKAVQIDNNAEVDSTISDINYEEIISAMTLEREREERIHENDGCPSNYLSPCSSV
jgi:hypothetical protein